MIFCFFEGTFFLADFKPHLVTRILKSLEEGDQQASHELLPVLYNELRYLACSLMAQFAPGVTLQPTALVHEAYLRLEPGLDPNWNSRGHFFSSAAQAMRQILVEQARRKASVKHGGHLQRADIALEDIPFDSNGVDILALDRALDDLQAVDERKVKVVLLRYLTGLSITETATVLEVSDTTVERDWRFAKAFLLHRLKASELGILGSAT